jgi:hypothetical protein
MAYKKIANIGLKEPGIYIASVESDGTPPELDDMTYIGDIVPGSLAREDDEDGSVQLKSQETGEVFEDILESVGTQRFTFSTWNFSVENLVKAMGGSVDTEGTWSAPIDTFRGDMYALAYVSRAKEDTEFHFVMQYPKCKLMGKMEGTQSEEDGNKLVFKATILRPTDSTTGVKKPDKVYKVMPTAPTNGVVDNTANTFGWTPLQNYPLATAYEFSLDGAGTWSPCTVNPQTGFVGAIPIGDAQIRVLADTTSDTKHAAGFALKNEVAFTT